MFLYYFTSSSDSCLFLLFALSSQGLLINSKLQHLFGFNPCVFDHFNSSFFFSLKLCNSSMKLFQIYFLLLTQFTSLSYRLYPQNTHISVFIILNFIFEIFLFLTLTSHKKLFIFLNIWWGFFERNFISFIIFIFLKLSFNIWLFCMIILLNINNQIIFQTVFIFCFSV